MEDQKKSQIVSKRLIFLAMAAPFLFSIGFMLIAFLATLNASNFTQDISLIIATFVGLGSSIGFIFLLQKRINKRIATNQK